MRLPLVYLWTTMILMLLILPIVCFQTTINNSNNKISLNIILMKKQTLLKLIALISNTAYNLPVNSLLEKRPESPPTKMSSIFLEDEKWDDLTLIDWAHSETPVSKAIILILEALLIEIIIPFKVLPNTFNFCDITLKL